MLKRVEIFAALGLPIRSLRDDGRTRRPRSEMKSKKLNQRLTEIDDAIAGLTSRLGQLASFTGRIDERVEELEERIRDVSRDGSAAAVQRVVENCASRRGGASRQPFA